MDMTHRYVVIEKEENPESEAKWKRDTNPLAFELPEFDKPIPAAGGLERLADRKRCRVGMIKSPPVSHGSRCNEGYGHAIVCEEASDVAMKVGRLRERAEEVG